MWRLALRGCRIGAIAPSLVVHLVAAAVHADDRAHGQWAGSSRALTRPYYRSAQLLTRSPVCPRDGAAFVGAGRRDPAASPAGVCNRVRRLLLALAERRVAVSSMSRSDRRSRRFSSAVFRQRRYANGVGRCRIGELHSDEEREEDRRPR